ncbi:hypothetical protein DPMN_121973 [Dreissena polymorpha]|uniref:Secreted protein n=1 Tax=Dreissena polymorpha TaxID=45954 RepID=A0A9D4GRJ2_DREPO|nr:hypothetical protein DPMN_121973 [Dreissena polymorpha]
MHLNLLLLVMIRHSVEAHASKPHVVGGDNRIRRSFGEHASQPPSDGGDKGMRLSVGGYASQPAADGVKSIRSSIGG